jgi:hypothetical protein
MRPRTAASPSCSCRWTSRRDGPARPRAVRRIRVQRGLLRQGHDRRRQHPRRGRRRLAGGPDTARPRAWRGGGDQPGLVPGRTGPPRDDGEGEAGDGPIGPVLRDRLAQLHAGCEKVRFLGYRIITGVLQGDGTLGPESSIVKPYWSECHQAVTDVAVDVLGADEMVMEGRVPLRAYRTDDPGAPDNSGSWVGTLWNATAGTIYAGTRRSAAQHPGPRSYSACLASRGADGPASRHTVHLNSRPGTVPQELGPNCVSSAAPGDLASVMGSGHSCPPVRMPHVTTSACRQNAASRGPAGEREWSMLLWNQARRGLRVPGLLQRLPGARIGAFAGRGSRDRRRRLHSGLVAAVVSLSRPCRG